MSELKPCPLCEEEKSFQTITPESGIPSGDDGYRMTIKCRNPECGCTITRWALKKSWVIESAVKAWSRRAQPDNEPLTLVFGRGELGVGTAYKAPDGPSREINIRRLSVPLQIASDTGDKGKYVDELENLLVRMQFENAESAHVLERAVRVVLEGFGQPSDDPLTLEELREMDGEPVWIDGGRFWALVSVSGQIVYLTENSGETVYADKWMKHMGNIYRRPPERGDSDA